MQQKFDGSFEISDILASLLFTSAATLRSRASAEGRLGALDSSTREKVYASIFVLAMLQKHYGQYENSWDMTADKAKQWVVTILMKQLNLDRVNSRKLVDDMIASV